MSAPKPTMSMQPGDSTLGITIHLSLAPVLEVEEMERFHRVAQGRGRTVPEEVAAMIRAALAEDAAA